MRLEAPFADVDALLRADGGAAGITFLPCEADVLAVARLDVAAVLPLRAVAAALLALVALRAAA
eukprot:16445699-Heterocapsa_arctica.AAC.1